MRRAVAVPLLLMVVALSGCASTAPAPPAAPAPVARPFDDVRRLAVVVSGESTFAVNENSAEPGRTFDQIITWGGYESWWRPIRQLVHRGINWLLEVDRKADASAGLGGVSPRDVVAEALASTLIMSGHYAEIRTFDREPLGEDRRRADAIVRLSVPAWGLVRVREGDPDLHSTFADVRVEMVRRGTGVTMFELREDVTDVERLPLTSFTGDREFARQKLLDVLERAGQRVAAELLYARGAGR
jgi:hypothetical protein